MKSVEGDLRSFKRVMLVAITLLVISDVVQNVGVHTMATKTSKKAGGRVKPPKDETPSQAFHRLAQGRTNKACKAIGLLSQLTGGAYESTEVQQRAIVAALEASVEHVKDTFAGKTKASDKFRLPS